MNNLCPHPIGQRLWLGRTPRAGSRALGHGYKGEGELRDVHAVEFKTKAGREQGFYVKVCEPSNAEFYLVSFDVRAPRGSFKRGYSKIVDEARWLLCANADRSTYICRARASAEMLVEVVTGLFEGYIKNIVLCPVRPDSDHDRGWIESLLEEVRRGLEEVADRISRRYRRWTLKVRRRFMERIERLRAVDASLANIIELRLGECLENISHGGSARGSSMVRGGGLWRGLGGGGLSTSQRI
jgi:hypothetical protein